MPGKLWHAINEGRVMNTAIELGPCGGIDEAAISAKINEQPLISRCDERFANRPRLPVRKRKDDNVVASQHLWCCRLKTLMSKTCQMRVNRGNRVPRMRVGGQCECANFRVISEQARHFTTGVATGAGNCNPQSHNDNLRPVIEPRAGCLGPKYCAKFLGDKGNAPLFSLGRLDLGERSVISPETQRKGQGALSPVNPLAAIVIDQECRFQ